MASSFYSKSESLLNYIDTWYTVNISNRELGVSNLLLSKLKLIITKDVTFSDKVNDDWKYFKN